MKEDLTVSGVELETKIMYNSNRMIKLLIAVTQNERWMYVWMWVLYIFNFDLSL